VKQWEIWEFPFPSAASPHLFVILSPTRLCADANFDSVNGLLCTTVRPPGRSARPHESFLDPADGLDWLTAVRCNVVFHFAKAAAGSRRGLVSVVRRRELARTLNTALELPA
jgi:hypothetical protein